MAGSGYQSSRGLFHSPAVYSWFQDVAVFFHKRIFHDDDVEKEGFRTLIAA
jgi:hypothetical protein